MSDLIVGTEHLRRERKGKTVVVTGATGFVGSCLCNDLVKRGNVPEAYSFSAMLAGTGAAFPREAETCVHLAARVHVMKETAADALKEYRRINAEGTISLARRAADAGCRRFVFISSIKVNGEETPSGSAFTADDEPAPEDAYGLSKYEAEIGLKTLAAETGMEVVIIRPPLVYGPDVRANFLAMMKLLDRGLPLPFALVDNRRSLVSLTNLSDFIITCLDHPAAANEVFLVSDGEDLSTKDLLVRLGRAMGRPARLLPVPPALLAYAARLLGKGAVAKRVLGSLALNIDKSRERLSWQPPQPVDDALGQVSAWYRQPR